MDPSYGTGKEYQLKSLFDNKDIVEEVIFIKQVMSKLVDKFNSIIEKNELRGKCKIKRFEFV